MATRISVILSAEGFEFVFICPKTASRSAWVIRLPAAIAEVAEVAVVINVLREMPEGLSDINSPQFFIFGEPPTLARIRRTPAWRRPWRIRRAAWSPDDYTSNRHNRSVCF